MRSWPPRCAALASPNLAVRYMAMTKLERSHEMQIKVLESTAVRGSTNPVLRARALWQVGRLNTLEFFVNAIGDFDFDPDSRFRILASLRVLFGQMKPALLRRSAALRAKDGFEGEGFRAG